LRRPAALIRVREVDADAAVPGLWIEARLGVREADADDHAFDER
jgi:hypothetical protein